MGRTRNTHDGNQKVVQNFDPEISRERHSFLLFEQTHFVVCTTTSLPSHTSLI